MSYTKPERQTDQIFHEEGLLFMTRTKICNRTLPDYTKGEELFNMISHIVGAVFGVIAWILCVIVSVEEQDMIAVVSSTVYGASLVLLYTMSSIYHELRAETVKKVFQVLDHCTIYFLIAGTYTPLLLCSIRPVSPGWAWTIFGIVWGFTILGTVFTAIDLKKYATFSMICYIGMGWCIVIAAKVTIQAIPWPGLMLLFWGGVAYTVGAILYGLGKKRRYMHSIFHLFVVLGSVLHFFCIFYYAIR